MDSPAPPPDQVRPTQVGGGEIPVLTTMKTSEQSPIKGMKNTEKPASLTKRKDGSIHLIYSTKTDIQYRTHEERQWMTPVPTDFDMCGLTRANWQTLLSCDGTIRTALTYDQTMESNSRQYKLSQVRKDELPQGIRQGGTLKKLVLH